MAQANNARDPTRKEATYIKSHASTLSDLPPPEEEWTTETLPDYLEDDLRRYVKLNIVERVDNPAITTRKQVYRTTQMGWQTIHNYAGTDTLPCGHTGWTFTGEGDKPFECLDCEDRCTEEELPL